MARLQNLEVPFPLAKELWEKVWQKFLAEEQPKINLLKSAGIMSQLGKNTGLGVTTLGKLKKSTESSPAPVPCIMSRETVVKLCDYIQDVDLKEKIFADPEARILFPYFGRYRLFWRDKKHGLVSILHSELQIGVFGVRLSGETGTATGGLIRLKNANLYFSVESENKKSSFILHAGTAGEDQLSCIPGFCMTLNADVTPVCMAVLLVRVTGQDNEPGMAFLDRYFDKFRGREFVPGVKISWFLVPSPYRIGGLFGNWYIFHARGGIIRRGKVRIESERRISYVGVMHEFHDGNIEIFNNTSVAITLCNDSKILHLLGRIGDQSDLGSRSHIPCIFSSTGRGGSTLKAGVSLMIRETETPFEEMKPAVIVREDYAKFLTEDDLKLILDTPVDIEI